MKSTSVNPTNDKQGQQGAFPLAAGSALKLAIKLAHDEAAKCRAEAWAEMEGDAAQTLEDPAKAHAYWEGYCSGLIVAANLEPNNFDQPTPVENQKPQ